MSNNSNQNNNFISTGSFELDNYLESGYEKGIVTTVYGPSGSGKTNICLLAATTAAKQGKVLIIDTEGGIAAQRIKQLAKDKFKEVLENILFIQPLTFQDQILAFEKLKQMSESTDIKMIIVDSIAMLYRLELGKPEQIFETNSALARQIATLVEIARKKHIPIIITNQVYSDFNNKDQIKMVGGDLLKYGSKCLLELQKDTENNIHKIILKKHRFVNKSDNDTFKFTISNNGISQTE